MTDLELAQAVLRASGWTALALMAGYVWARPYRCGMTSKEAIAVAARARRWALLATLGAVTQIGRATGLSGSVIDLTSTLTVFAVVAVGFFALEGRRR